MFIIRLSVSTGCRKQSTIIPEGGRVGLYGGLSFYPRPAGAVHAAAQNMSLSVLFHPPKGRRSTDFHARRPVPGDRRKQLIYQSEHFLRY